MVTLYIVEQLIIDAISSQVIIYEITRLKSRHKRLREVLLPAQAQCLNVFSEGRLCVGYQSGFTIYSLMGDQHPLCEYNHLLRLSRRGQSLLVIC